MVNCTIVVRLCDSMLYDSRPYESRLSFLSSSLINHLPAAVATVPLLMRHATCTKSETSLTREGGGGGGCVVDVVRRLKCG